MGDAKHAGDDDQPKRDGPLADCLGGMQAQFLTRPLWGVGSTGPYGHDGRSITLNDVILRHGGEAQASRDKYADLKSNQQIALQT